MGLIDPMAPIGWKLEPTSRNSLSPNHIPLLNSMTKLGQCVVPHNGNDNSANKKQYFQKEISNLWLVDFAMVEYHIDTLMGKFLMHQLPLAEKQQVSQKPIRSYIVMFVVKMRLFIKVPIHIDDEVDAGSKR